jgi:hypothetical protein
MILIYLSLLLALIAGLGRQIAVFGRIERGLWLFANWQRLRIALTLLSITLAIAGYLMAAPAVAWVWLLIIALLNAFAYFFDMPFFFPEVRELRRVPGSRAEIDGDTQVIGVQVGETAVAYPIEEIVMPRHIVHDTIEGTPILVSYCALCRTALIFRAEVEGERLYFKVAGVWRRNMIMIDDQTGSIWQQATGECLHGEYEGQSLELLSGENSVWRSWQKKHPDSEYANEFTEARRGLMSRKRMLAGLKSVPLKAGVPGMTDLTGLPKRETVFGITVNGRSKAYPLSELEPEMRFRDRVGGEELRLEYDAGAEYLSALKDESGEPLIVEKHWWLGWKEFHPETEIWRGA